MNNNELDNLVESFLSPKQQSKAMDLKELFALFDQMKLVEAQLQPVYPSGKQKGYEKEDPSISLFYEIYNNTLATKVAPGKDPVDKISNFINFVNELKKQSSENEQPNVSANLSNSLATVLFTTSLHKLIEDFLPDVPSSAGFFFEKFINLLFKTGTVSTENKINPFPIQDLEVEMGGKIYYLSLKLVTAPGATGSIGNMLKFFENQFKETYKAGNHEYSLINFDESGNPTTLNSPLTKKIIYLIANKTKQDGKNVIIFNMYEFNFQQFLQMLGKDKAIKYNNYLMKSTDEKLKEVEALISQLKNQIDAEEAGQEGMFDIQQQEDVGNLEQYELDLIASVNARGQQKLESLKDKLAKAYEEYRELVGESQTSSSSALKFNFGIKVMAANSRNVQNLELSMRSNERDEIIKNNKQAFDETIEYILNEAGLINYKVNNYFLALNNEEIDVSQKTKLASEAYGSAKKLEQNLGIKTGLNS
jgi:hypothetical protein